MTQRERDQFDERYGGCPEMLNGRHLIEWINLPALIFDDGRLHPPHRRGMCFACGQVFIQEGSLR